MSFPIEDGIPVPYQKSGVAKYPFREMEVGQSFFAPDRIKANAQQQMCHYNSRHQDTHFISRTVEGGVRIWRER